MAMTMDFDREVQKIARKDNYAPQTPPQTPVAQKRAATNSPLPRKQTPQQTWQVTPR